MFLTRQSQRLNTYLYTIRMLLKRSVQLVLNGLGYHLLTKPETISFLKPYQIMFNIENRIQLPSVNNCHVEESQPIFIEREGITDPVYVWRYRRSGQKAKQFAHGALMIQNKVTCADFNHAGFYHGLLHQSKRKLKKTNTLIAPWGQYLDGMVFGGYYDYVFLVLSKLCRIKDAVSHDEFAAAVVSYPLFDTTYEREYLTLLGISEENIVDSRYCEVKFENAVIANSGHWVYPNLADVLSIKKHIESKFNPQKTKKNRIFISRAYRRKITNEKELIILLKKYHFIIYEDSPRTVEAQVDLYKNADFIIGPHGASFSNIIWCEPGTHLYELFSPNYMPDFYLYLAKVTGMKYSAYYHGVPDLNTSAADALIKDVYVSIPDLERCLTKILEK